MLTDEEKSGPQMVLDVCDVLVQSIKELKAQLKEIYVDKELPLKERWYFFTKVPTELQDAHDYVMHFNEFETKYGEIEWYDTFVYDRHSSVWFVDMIDDQIESYLEDDEAHPEMAPFTRANLDEFKEAVLAQGYHSFVFDW